MKTTKGTFDFIKGAGTFQGHLIVTFADGSTRTVEFQGTTKPAGKLRLSEGTWTGTGGTGRWAGMKGKGTFASTRYPNKMTVTDFEGEATLPD